MVLGLLPEGLQQAIVTRYVFGVESPAWARRRREPSPSDMLLGERPMSEFGSRFALGRASYELHHDELEAFRHRINSSTSSLCALTQPVPPALSSHTKAAAEHATWKVPVGPQDSLPARPACFQNSLQQP